MSVLAHIEVLEKKHTELKEVIRDAQVHHLPDTEVTKLKKEKLKIKDAINSLLQSKPSNENTPI